VTRARRAAAVDVLVPTCRRPAALAVTLGGLAAQPDAADLRVVVSDQTPAGEPAAADDPVVTAVARVLRHRGAAVEFSRHLPARGMAEHRAWLLAQATAPHCLMLDDDVLLDPGVVARLREAQRVLRVGFVGAHVQGLTYAGDVRPHEHVALELVDAPPGPERVRKGDPAWERWRLHNAANLVHVEADLRAAGRLAPAGWVAYRVAWVGGCVLFDTAALRDSGGFDFWADLPANVRGEDVVAQLRVMERYGGVGVLPSGAWHAELPTQVHDRRVDAYARVLERDDAYATG
jgi:GT2 family glycosyltransferase